MKLFTALAVATASISTVVNAQTERDLDSHEHGTAMLNIAIDETAVFIELDTPWNNLVGFEHTPHSDDQQALVDQALATLRQPDQLFLLDGGDCNSSEVNVESLLAASDHSDHASEGEDSHGHSDDADAHDESSQDDHDDDKDEHSDDHDDDHKDEHSDDHDDDHKDEHSDDHDDDHKDEHADDHDDAHTDDAETQETHSTAVVTYTFTCANVASLSSIDVKLFDVWPRFADLDVQLIGPSGQALAELAPGQSLLDLTQVQ